MNFRQRKRGSTFILVLAMLSILVLVAGALSYVARLEGDASSNFAEITQARTAAATGLPLARRFLAAKAGGFTSTMQPWFQAPAVLNKLDSPAENKASGNISNADLAALRLAESGISLTGATRSNMGQALFSINDLSGRVNLNAISSEKSLDRFLRAVYSAAPTGSASQIRTSAVFQFRNTSPGTTTTLQPDLRVPAVAGTRRFQTVAELRKPKMSNAGLFTNEELDLLSDYVTVFSQSPEVYTKSDGTSAPRVALKDLTADDMVAALKSAYPDKDPRLLMQFAANAADYGDKDDIPTSIEDPQNREPWNTILGVEQTPFITEVYPDAKTPTDKGDKGQFVEIYNPWSKPLLMSGWQLVIAGTTAGAGQTVLINTVLPPGGYLIITDNYDHPDPESAPETGCFLAIFGTARDGNLRNLTEQANFNLPDRNSYVSLLDTGGNLIDVFSYTDAAPINAKSSYQRDDPRVRSFQVATATPFDKPDGTAYTGNSDKESAMQDEWKSGNSGISSPVDLLAVPSGFVSLKASASAVGVTPYPWQVPVVKAAATGSGATSNIDARVIDMFTAVEPAAASAATKTASVEKRTSGSEAGRSAGTGLLYSYGKLNLNTCPKIALYSLDGQSGSKDYMSESVIEKIETYRREKITAGLTPFTNLSDFVMAFYPNAKREDLAGIAKLVGQITVGSSSFEVTAENRAPDDGKSGSKRRPSIAHARWVIALDKQPYSLIDYSEQ